MELIILGKTDKKDQIFGLFLSEGSKEAPNKSYILEVLKYNE